MTSAEAPLLKRHTQQLLQSTASSCHTQSPEERRAAGAGTGSLGALGWRGVCICTYARVCVCVCVCVWVCFQRGVDGFALWAKSNQRNMEEVKQKESD